MRERDILVSLSGVPIDGVDTLQRVLSEYASGVSTVAVVLRGAEKLQLTIVPVSRSRN